MDKIEIREVKKSDFPMVKELVRELYDSLDVQDGMDAELSQAKFEDIIQEPTIHILVAEVDDLVVGYLTINFNKSLLDKGTTAIIDELIVSDDHRGKGLGRKLVEGAIDKCKQLNCSEVGVGTESINRAAREFYKACGFDEIGVILERLLDD